MKITLSILLAMILSTGMAIADDAKKQEKFLFDCSLIGTSAKTKSQPECRVLAEVCELDRDDPEQNWENGNQNTQCCRNLMAVSCDGVKVYEDGARHVHDNNFEFLKGIVSAANPTPVILRFDPKHNGGDDHFAVSAWLKVDGEFFRGSCAVRENHHFDVIHN